MTLTIFSLCRYKSGITLKELVFISYAGYIRGAVAFGLVLKGDESVPSRAVIVPTALSLVVFSTVVMGSTVSTLSRIFFQKRVVKEIKAKLMESASSEHEE